MAATSDEEEKKKLLTFQPNNAQILPQFQQSGLSDLLALMAAQRANAATSGTTAPSATTPTGGQSDLSAFLSFMSKQQKGFDPVAAQAAIRNTPVADYEAQQQIAASQAGQAGLAATAAEDVAANRATAKNVVSENFGGPPPLGDMFSKLLPANQGTLTAFPSGGYAVDRTPTEQLALQEVRRRNFASRRSLKPTGPRLTYGGSGYSSY